MASNKGTIILSKSVGIAQQSGCGHQSGVQSIEGVAISSSCTSTCRLGNVFDNARPPEV